MSSNIFKYSLIEILDEYKNHKEYIDAYIQNKPIEHYDGFLDIPAFTVVLFFLIWLIFLVIGGVLLSRNRARLSPGAFWTALIFLILGIFFPVFSIIAIIIILVART